MSPLTSVTNVLMFQDSVPYCTIAANPRVRLPYKGDDEDNQKCSSSL